MSEATILTQLQTELRRLASTFASADVTVNDWGVLDGPSSAAPFAIIEASDDFTVDEIQASWSALWSIQVTLIVKFDDWDTAKAALTTVRQTVINHLVDVEHMQSANGSLAVGIESVRSDGGIAAVYDKYNENAAEALPVFLAQRLIITVGEMSPK